MGLVVSPEKLMVAYRAQRSARAGAPRSRRSRIRRENERLRTC